MNPFIDQIDLSISNDDLETMESLLKRDKNLVLHALSWALELEKIDALECIISHLPHGYNWQEALEQAALRCSTQVLDVLLPYANAKQKIDMLEIIAVEGRLDDVKWLLPHCLPFEWEERNWEYATPRCKQYIHTIVMCEMEKQDLQEHLPQATKVGVVKKI